MKRTRTTCVAVLAGVAGTGIGVAHAVDVVSFGPGIAGKSRPTVVVQTREFNRATPAGSVIGIVTTWDTGASRLMIKEPVRRVRDLGMVNNRVTGIQIAGVSAMRADAFNEDIFVEKRHANLNAAETGLAGGVEGTARVFSNAQMDAVGCDVMFNSEKGIISIVDARRGRIKLINPDAANPQRSLIGSELLLFNGYNEDGTTNNRPFTTFDDAAQFPGRKITVTPTMLQYGGNPQRPVVTGSLVGRGVRGALRIIENKKGLWDTGAPTSMISRDLLHLGAGDAPEGKIKPKKYKAGAGRGNDRVILEEVRIPAGGDTLIFRDVQFVVGNRDAACPYRIGMNVLDRFAWLIDLHTDINIEGDNRSYQLKYIEIPVGDLPASKKVEVAGTIGQTAVVGWTDENGAPLLDGDLVPQVSAGPIAFAVPLLPPHGLRRFDAPKGAAGFAAQLFAGPRGVVQLKVGAGKEIESYTALDKEEGVEPSIIPACKQVAVVWDEVNEMLGGLVFPTLPMLGLDLNRDGRFADSDVAEPTLYMGIDVVEYLAGIPEQFVDRQWFYPMAGEDRPGDLFLIRDGRVYPCENPYDPDPVLGDPLPGVYVSLSPVEIDPLALAGEPLFEAQMMIGDFVAAAVGQLGVSTFCIADFNRDGGIDGADIEAFFNAWTEGDPMADVNGDGGIDGSDVQEFILQWENGSC